MKMKIGLLSLLLVFLTLSTHQISLAQDGSNSASTSPSITIEPMADGLALTASEVFSKISPSIAYIETASGTGSGMLIPGNYILTNAHVVYPFEQVRVVFLDGSEFLDAPVFAWDLMVDLALIGPIDTSIKPLALADGSGVEIGRDVYLVGYPSEVEKFPQPAITRGILSRIRHWDALDLSLFQADALVEGGQSGGVMVTHQGDVIGITTFGFDQFVLATSLQDALPRLEALLLQNEQSVMGDRGLNFADDLTSHGLLSHEGILLDELDEHTYLLNAPAGTEIDLYVEGDGMPVFTVVDEFGYVVVDSHFKGEAGSAATFTVLDEVPHYVQIYQILDYEYPYSLTSSSPVTLFDDPDDGAVLKRGDSVVAGLDTPLDYDYYEVYLDEDETVEISVDSFGVDTMLTLFYLGAAHEQIVRDSFGGKGIFGDNDRIVFRAPASGVHRLIVSYAGTNSSPGGYSLSVSKADMSAEPTLPQASRQLVDLPVGLMALYESDDYDLEILYPFDATSAMEAACSAPSETFCVDGLDVRLTITERDLAFVEPRIKDLNQYVDHILTYYEFDAPGFDLIGREPITTLQGLTGETFTFLTDAGFTIGSGVVFVDDANGVAFEATYFADSEQEYEWMAPLFAESFASYRSWGDGNRQQDPIHFLDQGIRHLTGGDLLSARSAFSQAIDLDPALIPAYVQRAYVLGTFDDVDGMTADIDKAIALASDEPALYLAKADLLYQALKYPDAMDAIDEVIDLNPFDPALYIMRAKIAAIQEDHELAFGDLNDASLLSEGYLVWEGWETLAFVHLILGDFEEAAEQYDSLYNDGLESPHVLVGAGIAYAELYQDDTALSLLEEGMQAVVDYGTEGDPQLAALYEMAEEMQDKLTE